MAHFPLFYINSHLQVVRECVPQFQGLVAALLVVAGDLKVVEHSTDILIRAVAAQPAHGYRWVCEVSCRLCEGGDRNICGSLLVSIIKSLLMM